MEDGAVSKLIPPTPPILRSTTADPEPRNTKNLASRLGVDLLSASIAAGLVAPFITIIDRSIIENASGRRPLSHSLRTSLTTLLRHPAQTLLSRPCALVFTVYAATFLTANTLDTAVATARALPVTHVDAGVVKFAASSAANIAACAYKDQAFARLFGAGVVSRPVRWSSYVMFAARDCMTVFASFNVPPVLGPVLTGLMDGDGEGGSVSVVSGQTLAQFVAPAAVQPVSTLSHLWGLDLYNHPAGATGASGWRERWGRVRRSWAVSTAARVCRIVPAFGLGGVVNSKVRQELMGRLA
ncbi:hypothetical protein VTJ49DRAFT_3213 [Mycothermus thermophilus]|uniref:Sequence orphan n=1 Tax=Humicola insolens TaxID=85995 RepID=A0ABR3VPH9_HUMIN